MSVEVIAQLIGDMVVDLNGTAELQVVGVHDDALWVTFSLVDFTLYIDRRGNQIAVRAQVTVREPKPGLQTWAGEWVATYPWVSAAHDLANDIRQRHEKYVSIARQGSGGRHSSPSAAG